MARPRKDDARRITYKVRLNKDEDRILREAADYTGSPRSEVFRDALNTYHRNLKQHSAESDQKKEGPDMSVPCGDGILNIRVGAIIQKNGSVLMVRNGLTDYYYSVGGRIKFGETAEEAVVREVLEETGVMMEIDHLGFIHENYFMGESPAKLGRVIYELSYYFYMKTPEDFEAVCKSITEDGQTEYLEWVTPDEPRTIFPAFFRTDLDITDMSVKHVLKDDRFYIRKMTPDDLEDLHVLLSDPEVMRYLEPPFNMEKTENFLKEQGLTAEPAVLAVDDKDHNFIGYVIFHDYDDESKEIGWVLDKKIWGQGMGSLLTKQLTAMASAEGKDAVIECVPEQTASKSIAEKNGFIKTGERAGLEVYRRNRNK